MSIENENNRQQFTGNGSAVIYPLDFRVDDAGWIRVFFGKDENQEEILNGFSVDGAGTDSVSVVFDAAPASGILITILRELPLAQTLALENTGPFHARDIENNFDLAVMMIQQIAERLSRSVTAPESSDPGEIKWADMLEARNTAVAAKNESLSARDIAVAAQDIAVAARDLAQKWAINPEDVEISPGTDWYSSYHWAQKSREAAKGTVAASQSEVWDGELANVYNSPKTLRGRLSYRIVADGDFNDLALPGYYALTNDSAVNGPSGFAFPQLLKVEASMSGLTTLQTSISRDGNISLC